MPTPPPPSTGAPAGPTPSGDEKVEPKKPFSLDELGFAGTVLAAIGGGLGVLGFVAFFGAAILWIRMTEVKVPGNEAVAVIPKPVLLTTGAGFLVPALLIALGFTVAVFLIDSATKWVSEEPLREKRKQLRRKREEARGSERSIVELEKAAALAATAVKGAEAAVALGTGSEGQVDDATAVQLSCQTSLHEVRTQQVKTQEEIAALEKELHDLAGEGRESMEAKRKGLLTAATITLFVVGAVWVFLEYSITLGLGRFVVLLLFIGLLITVVIVVRLRTDSFGWFAVATFVAVGLVTGALTYYRTKDDPKVEPAAVLRSHGSPVYGYYVAQTSDRVYLATTRPGDSVRLDSIPREEVLDLLVGELQPPAAADERALFYARNLCLRARQREATGKIAGDKGGGKLGEEAAAGCTAADLERLRAAEVH